MYNVKIWYMSTLWKDSSHRGVCLPFFFFDRNFKFYSLAMSWYQGAGILRLPPPHCRFLSSSLTCKIVLCTGFAHVGKVERHGRCYRTLNVPKLGDIAPFFWLELCLSWCSLSSHHYTCAAQAGTMFLPPPGRSQYRWDSAVVCPGQRHFQEMSWRWCS